MRDGALEKLAVRLAVAMVFVSSGVVKLLYANQGVGRFTKIGLPAPQALAPFVSCVEITCGILVLVGLATRLVAVLPGIVMVVALATTKLPLLFGAGPEPLSSDPRIGLLAFLYQARLDLAMLLCCAALVVAGAGAFSIDGWLGRRRGTA